MALDDTDLEALVSEAAAILDTAARPFVEGHRADSAVPWHDRFHHSGVVAPAMPMPRSGSSAAPRPHDRVRRDLSAALAPCQAADGGSLHR